MKLPGIVTNITNFGAFVDIGVHQDGLVHTSQLANRFVANPNDIVKVHQKVEVTVMEVDAARKRISLSMKSEVNAKPNGVKSKDQGTKNKEQGGRNKEQGAKSFAQKTQPVKKDADGDLQEKLAKLKGMFK